MGLALVISGLFLSPLETGEWLNDFKASTERARKEDKDLLVLFTGSDWCSWCIRLDREVFSREGFTLEARKRFVLVELDFPRRLEQPEKIREQNEALKKQFAITLWPTVYLLDARGRPYAKTGYEAGGEKKYLKRLEALRKRKEIRDRALKAATSAKGLERARHLDKALSSVGDLAELADFYADIVAEIKTLDADNKGGLKFKYSSWIVRTALRGGDFDGALKKLEVLMRSMPLEGLSKQEAYYLKGTTLNQKEDLEGSIAAFKVALSAAPKSKRGKSLRAILRALQED